jgi:hypothetical protein
VTTKTCAPHIDDSLPIRTTRPTVGKSGSGAPWRGTPEQNASRLRGRVQASESSACSASNTLLTWRRPAHRMLATNAGSYSMPIDCRPKPSEPRDHSSSVRAGIAESRWVSAASMRFQLDHPLLSPSGAVDRVTRDPRAGGTTYRRGAPR